MAILGDFNLLHIVEDTTGGIRNLGTMRDFNNFIHELGLTEAPLGGRTFTWSSKRQTPTFSKLDRALLSHHWNDLGASYSLSDLLASASDHTPLMLTLKPHRNPQRRPFKLELFWLKYQDVHEKVNTACNSVHEQNPIIRRQKKISAARDALKRWSHEKFKKRETFLSRSKWVLQQLDRAEEQRPLSSLEFCLSIRLREHIFILAVEKEAKWKHRSGCTWLKFGDKNTKYFHAVANSKKNSNAIVSLSHDDPLQHMGNLSDGTCDLPRILRNHFKGTTTEII